MVGELSGSELDLRWVIQTNLGSSKDAESFARACEQAAHEVERLVRAPFDAAAPSVPSDRPTVFYGASSLVEAVAAAGRWQPGVWPLREDYGDWVRHYGEHMLNAGARFSTLAELAADASLAADERLYFARPSADTKLFAGQVAAGSALVVLEAPETSAILEASSPAGGGGSPPPPLCLCVFSLFLPE